MKRLKILLLALPLTLWIAPVFADGWSNVAINGQRLTSAQLRDLELSIGGPIAPGHYLVNAAGCWLNLTTGSSGCLSDSTTLLSRYGSGERTGDGGWNHWSNAAGAGVGGTTDGCIYTTTGWSNC